MTGCPQTRRNGALRLAVPTEGQPCDRDVEKGQETEEDVHAWEKAGRTVGTEL